ncbi:unnamed protein product [Arabis nemorensis]|uniref:F-box domain-containing protein n=1 Tax=Arabis nemorensis TaxID=586526 RepID=A0A565C2I6_9BRAS|nr:unnamed protein product [Arabis nemorensis]
MASSSSPPSSSSLPPVMEDGEFRDWADIPPELTSSILLRLGTIEIVENAQKVCKSWRRVCKDPSMWKKIDMHNLGDLGSMNYDLEIMCRHAVDRSQGGLIKIDVWYFGTDHLLNYIAERFCLSLPVTQNLGLNLVPLHCMGLGYCVTLYSAVSLLGNMYAIVKFPLLEDLEVSYCSCSGETLKVVGRSCLNLKTLKLNRVGCKSPRIECDDDALAIAETMLGLRHLQLFGNRLTDTGLMAILDNCPNLEHLDLRQCFNVNLVGDLGKRCSERIKVVRRPNDSTHGYPYDATAIDMDSSDSDHRFFFDNIGYYSDSNSSNDLPGDSDYNDYDHYDYGHYDHDPWDHDHYDHDICG